MLHQVLRQVMACIWTCYPVPRGCGTVCWLDKPTAFRKRQVKGRSPVLLRSLPPSSRGLTSSCKENYADNDKVYTNHVSKHLGNDEYNNSKNNGKYSQYRISNWHGSFLLPLIVALQLYPFFNGFGRLKHYPNLLLGISSSLIHDAQALALRDFDYVALERVPERFCIG